MTNPYDALRDAAEALAHALRDEGHRSDDKPDSCLGCAALSEYEQRFLPCPD